MQNLKIGVMGVGNMGKNHVRILTEVTHKAELVGIYDVNKESVLKTGYQGKIFSSPEEFFKEVDAAVIAVPSSFHKKYALMAADMGVHILVEKPLALGYEDAFEINERYKKNKKVLMVGHVERYNPIIMELEKILKNEDVLSVIIERCSPMDKRISDTDVIYDLTIHDVDILINSIAKDDNAKVFALGRKVYSENFCDYVQAMFSFENKMLATIISSRSTEDKIRMIKIHCKNSFIEANLLNKSISISRKTNYHLDMGYSPIYRQENIMERVFVPNTEPLKNELLTFIDCIENNAINPTDGNSALKSIKILDLIREQVYG